MTEPTSPVLDPSSMSTTTARRPRAWRWAVAFLVSVAMLLAMTGVAVFAQTGSGGGPAFVPATATAFGEIRLDMPGNQHDELAAFMAHLPGFADPSSFDTKLNEALDELLSSGTGGAATWTGNIQTWSNGQFAIGLLALPAATATGSDAQPQVVVGLGVKDRAALEEQIQTLVQAESPTTEDYAGATITTAGTTSYAVTDQYLLVSPSVADLKTSLDVLAGTTPSLADDPSFTAAAASLASPNLGEFYVATSALKPLLVQQLSQQPGGAAIVAQLDNLPLWVGGYAQVASSHVTLGVSTQLADSSMLPSVRETDLAAHFPAGTLGYLETRDLGTTVDALLAQLKLQLTADSSNSQMITGIEQQLGPLDQLLSFVEDGAVGISIGDTGLSAGIVATLSDEAVGGTRVQTLLGLLRIVGGGANSPFTVTSADVNGVTVTTITLQPSAGIPSDLPFTPALSVAVSDSHLYLGLGDFAATALAQDPSTSLASNQRYTAAVAEAGAPNAGVIWVDLAAVAPLAASMVAANDPTYDTDIKPWIDALDSFVATATVDGDIASLKALLFVK